MRNTLAIIVAIGALVSGCASAPLGAPTPTIETVQAIKSAGILVNVGEFKPAAKLKPASDKSVSVRGSTVSSPINKSFSAYVRESLLTELQASGGFSPDAKTTITGELTRNELNAAGASFGTGTVAARFIVSRNGQVLYDAEQTVDSKWESSFMGAIAIPRAFNEYGNLYKKLVTQVINDAAFISACKAP